MGNELVLKKLFALTQGKAAPALSSPKEHTMPQAPTIMPRKLKLPRDASIHHQAWPPELYISMTITKVEHIQALAETLETFSRLLEDD